MKKYLLILLNLIFVCSVFAGPEIAPSRSHQMRFMSIFSGGSDIKEFRFTVTTVGADTFQLPIYNGGTYDFTVNWGDGNSDIITAWDDAAANHSYTRAGTYVIRITGTITGWRFANAGDKTLIHEIKSWGPLLLGNNHSYFYGCSNLTITATDTLDLTGTTEFYSFFRGCSSLTTVPSMNSWDVSAVTDTHHMFYQCTLFNQDISSWDTALIDDMQYMFYQAAAFNQDISGWDTSSNTSMGSMFREALTFNQDIGSWETGLVTTMQNALRSTPFNQDIGSWDTGACTLFSAMFYANTVFDQDISGWDIADITDMTNMLTNTTLSTVNYDALLIGWEGQVEQPNVTFHAGNSVMTLGGAAEAARDALVVNGWTITDSTGVHT